MSHCCNNGPVTVKVYPNAPAVCPDTPEYLFENDNLSGVGVFSEASGTNILFRGIASSGGTIDVTLDAVNKTVNVELDADIVAGNFPDATTVIKGKTAYSTNAEALAKASTTKAVTPSNFAAMGASTTFAGFVELATQAETQLGTSTTLAVTPDGLKSVTNGLLATQSVANDAARAAAIPAAVGQLLLQRDVGAIYRSTSLIAGSWALAAIPQTGTWDIPDLELRTDFGSMKFNSAGDIRVTQAMGWEGDASFYGNVDFTSISTVKFSGVAVPAASVVLSAGAGELSSALITQFLSSFNESPLYDPLTFTPSRTLNSGTATTTQIADVLCTLITDLASLLKPIIP